MRSLLCAAACLCFGLFAQSAVLPVEDFSKPAGVPSVWVVNIPNENASVKVKDGALELEYHFTGGKGQYLGVVVPLKLRAPFTKLKYRVKGNGSKCGYGLYLTDAGGETHKYPSRKVIDWEGWREIEFQIDCWHEIWGGDKNQRIDYPIRNIVLEIGSEDRKWDGVLVFDDIAVETVHSAVEMFGREVKVVSPAYASTVSGDVKVQLACAGFEQVDVKCWNDKAETVVAKDLPVGADGKASFVFKAGQYPKGPLTLTVTGKYKDGQDNCYLQLYNAGGSLKNAGIPKQDPPAAKGLRLVYADDFDKALSIGDGDQFRYYDHKPPKGQQDFSTVRFTSHNSPKTPFSQVDTYLRIRADANKNSSGLLSSAQNSGAGVKVKAPCYFECRMIGPNAIGSWPAFWLMTDYMTEGNKQGGCDELDVIEAYGGEGKGHPNAYNSYCVTPHAWNQDALKPTIQKYVKEMGGLIVKPGEKGIKSAWFETFHTYGCLITETDTIYYCDDVEVKCHPTLPLSKERPFFFMINLATGGGWPVDLSRYDGVIDMYVDYVRVYGK